MVSDLAFHLAKNGHHVEVVCSRQLYESAKAILPAEENIAGVHVHRAWSTRFGRSNLAGRAVDYLSFYVGACIELFKRTTPGTIVVAKTDPPLISMIAAVVVRWKSAKLVNWLQDLFPEVAYAISGRAADAPGRFERILIRLRNWSLNVATSNIVLGHRMEQLLLEQAIPAEKIAIIPNWSDAERVSPVEHQANPLRQEWSLEDKFCVMYSGNLGRAHEFDTILGAMTALRHRADIQFVIVGGGAKLDEVKSRASSSGLLNVTFQPYQPESKLAMSLSAGDAHMISLLPELEGLIVPSKFYGVLAAGRPCLFIGDASGELAQIINAHQVGFSVTVNAANELSRHIEYLADNRDKSTMMGRTARSLFILRYQRRLALDRWEALLSSLDA